MSGDLDKCTSSHGVWPSTIDDILWEIKAMRAEQLQANEQLLAGLQLISMPTGLSKPSQGQKDLNQKSMPPLETKHLDAKQGRDSSGSTDEQPLRETPIQSKSLVGMPRSLEKARGAAEKSNDSHRWVLESRMSKPSSNAAPPSPAIPNLCDLERRMLRDASSSQSVSLRPHASARRASEVSKSSIGENRLHPVVVQPQPLPPHQPDAPQPDPPVLPTKVSKAHTTSGNLMGRRGSALGNLTRDSQAHILSLDSGGGSVCQIFVKQIGVSLWLNWSTCTSFIIILMNICYLVLAVVLYISGSEEVGEQWTALSLLVFSTVAVLLLQLVKRSLRSEDLNMAMRKLDEFVQDCGHGLDWGSVAKKHWFRFLGLWAVVLLAFIIQQVLEVWLARAEGFGWSGDVYFRALKAVAGVFLFAVSSAVVMNGAYCQFNLLLGLGKTVDCWCADIIESQDFISGIKSWNALQALLKCVGREVTPCFTVLNLLGYAGFFAALAGSFSLLLDEDLEGWKVALYESALLPLVYLFYLSARLFAQGASVSEKCHQIPAFVNQLSGQGADTDRQYLVRYISDSAAGFIVHGITLSQSVFLRQMHFLTAVFSGFTGILLRRYL